MRLVGATVLAPVVRISVGSLTPGQSLRERPLNREHVERLIATGGDWPPLLVLREGLVVVDGHHRLAAATELKLATTAAVMYDGPPEDALAEAIRANVNHGLPLTLRERRRAALSLVASHGDWSDRMIAKTCGIAAATVNKLRIASDNATSGSVVSIQRRLGLDGRYRPANPGDIRERLTEVLSSRPGATLRAIAAEVGCSPATVHAARKSVDHHDKTPEGTTAAATRPWAVEQTDCSAKKSWRSDSACASSEGPRDFAHWFDRTSLESSECFLHLANVPLSRVYEVADEAIRRARIWSDFAVAVQRRSGGRG